MTHIRSLSLTSTSTSRSNSSQSLLSSWNLACQLFDSRSFLAAYEQFSVCTLTAKCLFNQALCLLMINQPPESSVVLLIDATTIDPYFVPAWILLAELSMRDGEWQRALDYLRHAELRKVREMDFTQLGMHVVVKLPHILLLEATCYRELHDIETANGLALSALQIDASFKNSVCKWLSDSEPEYIEWDLFRPTPLKLAALEPNDYLGTAVLIATNAHEFVTPILIKCHYKGEVSRWVERDSKSLCMAHLKVQVVRKFDIQGNCKILTKTGYLLIDDQDLQDAMVNQSKLRLHVEDYN